MNILSFQRRCLILPVGKGSIKRANSTVSSESYKSATVPSNFAYVLETEKLTPVPKDWFSSNASIDGSSNKLEALEKSIQKFGVLEPILVRKLVDDNFQVLSGYKRIKVCDSLNIKSLNCIIIENISDEMAKDIFMELHKSYSTNISVSSHNESHKAISKISTDLPNYLL